MKPVICNYYLTYRCNASCDFCTIWRDTSVPAPSEAPPEVVMDNCSRLAGAGVKVVDFTGGEPLLYKGLPEVLAHACSAGLRTTVTTNGIAYPARARELAGLVDYLHFSIDGPVPEMHDAVKGEGAFEKLMESIETARSMGERFTLTFTVTDDNMPLVPDMLKCAGSLGVLLFFNPCFSYPGVAGLSPRNARRLSGMVKGPNAVADRGYLAFVADGGNRRTHPLCRAGLSSIVVSPDDNIILPCFHYRKRTLPIQGRLGEVLTSAEYREAAGRAGTYPFCEGCTVYCYMRASLYRSVNRYVPRSLLSGVEYLYKRRRLSGKRC